MARKLSVKFKKHRRDQHSAYSKEKLPTKNKVARQRSTKAKLKKAFTMS